MITRERAHEALDRAIDAVAAGNRQCEICGQLIHKAKREFQRMDLPDSYWVHEDGKATRKINGYTHVATPAKKGAK